MAKNNPNKNRETASRLPAGDRTGFPGMNIPAGKAPRSSEEVADAHKQNVEHGKQKKAEPTDRRPF